MTQRLRRSLFWASGGAFLFSLVCLAWGGSNEASRFAVVGTQAWTPSQNHLTSKIGPRISVLETDTWSHSLTDGRLTSVSQLPRPGHPRKSDLLYGARFTPEAYLEQIAALRNTYCRQRDILMYYGGVRRRPRREGLNFNGWSGHDLNKLRILGCRPFIGLETMDRADVRSLAWRLKEAGFGPLDRIYVRIGSEPTYSAYGKDTSGKRHTAEAYALYRKNFARTSAYLNELNRRFQLNIHTVFAGANNEDFTRYCPPEWQFDAIGYDLYVTPENQAATLKQLKALSKRYPYKPLVIPELGIATEGPARVWSKPKTGWAEPVWANGALADVLEILSQHPAGIEAMTVFSVNVSGRMEDRRWNWAWTPTMYEMLKEWMATPRRWRKAGFHPYDPTSFPTGRDILILDRSDSRIVYRKLLTEKAPGMPLFEETRSVLRDGRWISSRRVIYFQGLEPRRFN